MWALFSSIFIVSFFCPKKMFYTSKVELNNWERSDIMFNVKLFPQNWKDFVFLFISLGRWEISHNFTCAKLPQMTISSFGFFVVISMYMYSVSVHSVFTYYIKYMHLLSVIRISYIVCSYFFLHLIWVFLHFQLCINNEIAWSHPMKLVLLDRKATLT